jgi:hypothetical protein
MESLAPTKRLEREQGALEEANARLAELNARRNAALLGDDNAAAIELGIEIANLNLATRAHADKIQLLREAAAREEQARREKEREGLVERIEKKLAERDSAGKELASAIAKADQAYRKLLDIGLEVMGAWNWPASDLPACLLSHGAITAALTHEMYRIGGRPMLGGGQVEKLHAGIHFPGARVPRYELTHLPEKIVPLTGVLQQATAHASNILRGKRPSAEVEVSASAPAVNGSTVTTAEARLAGLWKRQAELEAEIAKDPAREREYFDVVAQIAAAQSVVTAEQQAGAAHATGS